MKTVFFVLLLFGSYAKGKQTKSSDINLLFISNEGNFENKISDIPCLLEEYENAKDDASEIASIKSDEIIELYGLEMDKRSRFQYEMTESIQEQKANTSLKSAKRFMFEMKKLL